VSGRCAGSLAYQSLVKAMGPVASLQSIGR
jgi:hypothetical protein